MISLAAGEGRVMRQVAAGADGWIRWVIGWVIIQVVPVS